MELGARIGRYRIVRRLGQGGLGDVYLAFDESLEREVAIKLLHKDAAQAGLREEARTLAALRHPNVVRIYEIGEHEGQDFLAMEYVPGRSLRHVLLERALERRQLLDIFAKVAGAVQAAHRARVLHRDLKPENVLVTAQGEVTVVDFGQARRIERPSGGQSVAVSEIVDAIRKTFPPPPDSGGERDTILSVDPEMIGTPAYMAPEVMTGTPSVEASDVYSLGVMLYECLAGRRPWSASTLVELIAQMIEEPPAPLEDPLAPLAIAMLARDPDDRPKLHDVLDAVRPQIRTPQSLPVASASASLAPVPRRGNLRFAVGVAAGIAVTASAAVAFVATRSRSEPPAPPADPPPSRVGSGSDAGELPHARITAGGRDRMVDWGALSPDAMRLAFSDPDGLHVQDIASGERTSIPFPDRHPRLVTWYPSGEALLVTACGGATDCDLWRVDLPSLKRTLLLPHNAGGVVSPDGTRIASYDSDGNVQVSAMTDPTQPLWYQAAVHYAREPPAWSPDGALIAFIVRDEHTAAYAIELRNRTHGVHKIAIGAPLELADNRFALAFTGNHQLVYGTSEPGQPFGTTLWAQALEANGAANGRPVPIAHFPGLSVSHLSAPARGGMRIAALATSTQGDIYVGSIDPAHRDTLTAAPKRLTVDDRDDRGAAWLDDTTVLYASNRRGTFAVYAQGIDETDAKRLTDVPQDATWPIVRGDNILYWTATDAESSVMRMPRAGGEGHEIAYARAASDAVPGGRPPPIGLAVQCAAPPSERCLMSTRRGNLINFFELGDMTRPVVAIELRHPADNWEWSMRRDGKVLAFPDGEAILTLPLEGATVTTTATVQLQVQGALWHSARWDADGDGLYATGIVPGAEEFQLVYIAPGPAGKRTAARVWSSAGAWLGEPAVSPDGKRLAFTVKPLESDVWTLDLP